MDTNNFEQKIIQPFFWVEHGSTYSVCLNVGEYKAETFGKEVEVKTKGVVVR
jgi:hypothetical protein